MYQSAVNKAYERVSPILVTLTSHSDYHFKRSNISLKESKLDGVDLNSDGLDTALEERRKNSLVFKRLISAAHKDNS